MDHPIEGSRMNGVVLLFAAGVVLLLAVGVIGYVLEQKRRDRLMQWCVNRGWSYLGEDPSLVGRWTGAPFGQGERRRARNVIHGSVASGAEKGRPFTAFDYSYETYTTDSKGNRTTSTHRFGVYAVALPAYLPTLQVTREGAFRRLAGAMGLMRDIELESEDFNRAFSVRAADPKFASDVLSPRTMEFLLTVPDLQWRIEGTSILCWDTGRMQPEQIVVATAVLDRVTDGIPGFVWKDHGYNPPYYDDPPHYDPLP
jgi:hypothetical protein